MLKPTDTYMANLQFDSNSYFNNQSNRFFLVLRSRRDETETYLVSVS